MAMMQQLGAADARPVSTRRRDWTSPGRLRLRLLFFCLYAAVYWAIVAAVLAYLHIRPLLVEGFNQHIVSAPSAFTVGALKFIITVLASVLTLGLADTAKGVLEMDLALRLQAGLPAGKLNRSWSALTGSLLGLPNRYTLVLINAAVGAAILSTQFGVYTTVSSDKVSLNVTGADLDQRNVDGDVLPYYREDSSSSLSRFYNSMAVSDLRTYHAKLDAVESFDRLDVIYNSLARPAAKFSDGNRGGLIYQHQTAFGAPYDVASYAPFYGDISNDDRVTTCAQTFAEDAISCQWYTTESGAISNFEASRFGDGATFELDDPALDGYGGGASVTLDELANVATQELDSGDFAVIFASIDVTDWIALSSKGLGTFPRSGASGLVSGRCLVRKDPFRFSPVSWQRVGDADVALTAPFEADDVGLCSGSDADPNTLLPHNNATSAGMVLAEHIAALLVPPEQNGQSMGWLLKSRLTSTLYGAYETEDVLTYVVRGLLSAGMVSPTGQTDTMPMAAQVDAISYYNSFGVQGDAWILVLLALPALSTVIALVFSIKLFFGRRPALRPANLFEVTKLILAPRTSRCTQNAGSPDEKQLTMRWDMDKASMDCWGGSDAPVIQASTEGYAPVPHTLHADGYKS
ncbi:uncharacterized protein J7T54_000474 [Emericellopsis cladophorae]|uniref:Uncharacterized protein n=1 Tax=Emericellopsis cladophorae TaxID=2686198 RepID=A0A9Q0BC54_9HYPO|nr:uncharacterized protein J7T54_000474 [Emericellopsis cladophorae]KAI6779376.1 hypothetical protein J7T54_000474 [Emericellopsis cladophorae]